MNENLKKSYDKLISKDFTFYFFVIDSRNIPNGSMFYSYTLAKEIQDLGYRVKMIYQYEGEDKTIPERSFIGVKEWLGEEYSDGLEHVNMSTTEIKFTSLDYIMIPMATPSLILELREYKVPSHVIMLCNNSVLPLSTYDVGVTYNIFGFTEVWCSTEHCENLLRPLVNSNTKINVVRPLSKLQGIDLKLSDKPLSVCVYSINENKMKELYNTFISIYPKYDFVTFTPIRMFSYKDYNNYLNTTPILVWIDDDSVSGQTLQEFGERVNITLAKRGNYISEVTSGFSDKLMIWTDSVYELSVKLGSVIESFLKGEEDKIEESIKASMNLSKDELNGNVKSVVNSMIDNKLLKTINSLGK